MIVYNVTVSIELEIAADWLEWMREAHIPEVLATGFFEEARLLELTAPAPEPGSITFSIQYFCANLEALSRYQAEAAPILQEKHTRRYKDRFVAFRTQLKVVDTFAKE